MKILPDRECVQCKKIFTPNRKWTIYCSDSCKMQHYYENRTRIVEKLEAEVLRLRESLKNFEAKKQVFKECYCCKKEFNINSPSAYEATFIVRGSSARNRALFCSEECKIKYISENPQYKFLSIYTNKPE